MESSPKRIREDKEDNEVEEYPKSSSELVRAIFGDDCTTDIQLTGINGGSVIKMHSSVLAQRSLWFRTRLTTALGAKEDTLVLGFEMGAQALLAFKRYIYLYEVWKDNPVADAREEALCCGQLMLASDFALLPDRQVVAEKCLSCFSFICSRAPVEALTVAVELGLDLYPKAFLDSFLKSLEGEKVCQLFELLRPIESDWQVRDSVINFVRKEYVRLPVAELSTKILIMLLKDEYLNVESEVDVALIVHAHLNRAQSAQELSEEARALVQCVRFPTIGPHDLFEKVRPLGLLNEQQYLQLLHFTLSFIPNEMASDCGFNIWRRTKCFHSNSDRITFRGFRIASPWMIELRSRHDQAVKIQIMFPEHRKKSGFAIYKVAQSLPSEAEQEALAAPSVQKAQDEPLIPVPSDQDGVAAAAAVDQAIVGQKAQPAPERWTCELADDVASVADMIEIPAGASLMFCREKKGCTILFGDQKIEVDNGMCRGDLCEVRGLSQFAVVTSCGRPPLESLNDHVEEPRMLVVSEPEVVQKKTCTFWEKGNCRFGSDCWNRHGY